MCSDANDARSIPIVLPDFDAGDEPVRLAQWLVPSGEPVLENDRVAEVLVGGILFHVTSPADGTLDHRIEQDGSAIDGSEPIGFVRSQQEHFGNA